MTLFEAGILAKMTTDEYKNLPEQSRRSEPVTESDRESGEISGDSPAASQTQSESTKGLEPVSLVMLRGAFCLLGIGYLVAALALVVEIQVYRRRKHRIQKLHPVDRKVSTISALGEIRSKVRGTLGRVVRTTYGYIDRALGPAV